MFFGQGSKFAQRIRTGRNLCEAKANSLRTAYIFFALASLRTFSENFRPRFAFALFLVQKQGESKTEPIFDLFLD